MANDASIKTIHLAGLGAAGIGLARCFKGHYKLQGHDASPWAEQLAKSEGIITGAEAEDMWYTDMIIPTPDPLVKKYAGGGKMEGECSALSFLPDLKQIELCQDKAKCAAVLGDLAPKTYWLRDTVGAGGAGAQMCSEFLPGRNISIEFCFKDGGLIGSFVKERISYSLKHKTTGLEDRGSSVVSVCRKDPAATGIAMEAVAMIAQLTQTPAHGFYGVDLKQNEHGEWKVTEINAGRLLTASYSYFYLTGYNLALAGVKAFLGEQWEFPGYPEGYGILRQIDCEPVLCDPDMTKDWK